ncbi:MAG: prephenate dehydrogenase/arogenate dehydrogenase family protein [Acidimicrobiales bacterium]|nr:prephenate dehydrogenase/arogenate dehydrogenase family protein [Acidimicrobiales bacterium]
MSDSDAPDSATARANIVGVGLIGGSIGLALRRAGWHVSGSDDDRARVDRALELGVLDGVGLDPDAEITFIATPVRAIAEAAGKALAATTGLVTDVGSVKAPIIDAVDDERFVGGHPMAGSEQVGVDGADADLFTGAVWVITPTGSTDDAAYARVRAIVASLGAEILALPPERHDEFVAVVSHVPHLTAASLMRIADDRADEHAALLRLAAGGFRDMTRIASGHPGIWPDICAENRAAIVAGLDRLIDALGDARAQVAEHDHDGLLEDLTRARAARVNLPSRYTRPSELAEIRVPVPDRPGVLAEVTTLASELDVNIADVEIVHSSEGVQGVVILLVEASTVGGFRERLTERGFRPSVRRLS